MTRYEKGFIEKCAEYGVDGMALLKSAKILGGPEPTPGMLGASSSSSKGGNIGATIAGAGAGGAIGGGVASYPAIAALWNEEIPVGIARNLKRNDLIRQLAKKHGVKLPKSNHISKSSIQAIAKLQMKAAKGRKALAAAILGIGMAGGSALGGFIGNRLSRRRNTKAL